MNEQPARILYCHCAYAKVVPAAVKSAVLDGLSRAEVEFDAVPDLCEMAAARDPRLRELGAEGPLSIAACYPRAVRWLFASAGAPLPEQNVRIWNMRLETAEDIVTGMLAGGQPAQIAVPGDRT
jgi:hypothetical protein